MNGERGIMKKTMWRSVASLMAAGVLMSGCMADFGGESESEGVAAEGANVVEGEALGESKQALTCGVLTGGQTLFAGQSNTSCDGRINLVVQATDGNVVLYAPQPLRPLWATYAYGAGNRLVMQNDGNLVVYTTPGNRAVWHSRTYGYPGAWLAIQNDGSLVIYSASNEVLWTRLIERPAVYNGSFEIGVSTEDSYLEFPAGDSSIPGWTVGGAGIDYKFTYWRAANGIRSIDLNRLDAGSIETKLTTTPGKTYTIYFAMAGNVYGGPAIKNMTVTANGGSPKDYSFDTTGKTPTDMGWTTHNYSFVAQSASTQLKFTSTTPGAHGPAIDLIR
jgi:choice-of-anchor C domain-containing protein